MKLKTVNKFFAATAAGFLFTNASIAVNAEELPPESAVISQQDDSGREAEEAPESGSGQTSARTNPEQTASDEGGDEKETENIQQDGESGQLPEQQPGQPVGQPAEQQPDQSTEQSAEQQPDQSAEQQPGQSAGQPAGQQPEVPDTESSEAADDTQSGGEQLPGQPEPEGTKEDVESAGQENAGIQEPEQTDEGGTQTKPEESRPQITGPVNFEEAEENLEKAKEEENRTKAELDKAQTEADSAQADVNKAQQDVQEADAALGQAQDKKQEAEAEKQKADKEAAETEQAVSEAEKKLDGALENAGVDKNAYEEVQQQLDAKKDALDKAESEDASAEAEYNEKKTAAEEAAAEEEKLQSAFETAKKENQAAEEEVSVSQKEQAAAQKAYDDALKENAGAASAKQELDNAQAALNAAQEQAAKGSLGFFQYLAGEGSQSAKEAVTILTSKDKSEVKGLGNENIWTAESWEKFISYTKIGDGNDATSLENMRRAIAFIRECNELRMADGNFPGLNALVVNDAMMAIAQLNANWATYNADGTFNSHSKVFNAGENLAWYYLDVPGMSDPFKGWYYEEKEIFDNKTAGVTGHYENIVNGSYSATGFGVNLSEKSGDIRLNCSQEFSSDSLMNYYAYGQSYSVDEYEARFMSYYNSVMKTLSDAKTAYNAAKAAYDKAVAAGGGAAGGSQADISAKKAQLDKATARLEAAKADAGAKLERLNAAQTAYDAGVQKRKAAQAEFEQSRVNFENSRMDLQQKQEAYGALRKEIEDNYGSEVLEASGSLAQARSAHARASESQAAAQDGLLKAQAKLAAAVEAKEAADKNLKDKTDILAVKLENLQKAKEAHTLALANLSIAQADYERFRPRTTQGVPSSSYETVQADVDPASMGDVIVNVSEFSGGSSKSVYFARRCSFKYFLENSADFIKGCSSDSLILDCSELPWFSFNRKTLDALRENPNLSLKIIFTYKGRKYTFTIPAGYDLNLLQDANGWYGFMYLSMIFGGQEII